ncbi:pseudouridine synthase, RluA family [Desulfosporosinus orientis DSM 765]|uniref:Pseudouridine synthase n=1 Tax=Desulfosporosinus orientis (strain ATCC 19365 / DSM 765 / NCIMB 8382 / VKM B-1628 / Singapore I) TaxID=768706 RepID=G7WIP6_DESOD|nr:RluA family pseudouridine synthase [Desulfosporosinus orientis]AET69120.1 pseudouridine synthase, RluA family [Desulfosporosinus orientis DSM 765]
MNTPPALWEYRLGPDDSGQKYLSILLHKFHFSIKLLNRLKKGERVWVNGKFTYLTSRGKEGDLLSVELFPDEEATIKGEDLPLDILFEDEYLLAVNKPVGQVVHPNNRYPTQTLGNAVIGHWERRGENRLFRPIHRIDRNTSGVVVIAKNQFAHQQLAWQLERGHIHKRYHGFVQGVVAENEGTIDDSIGFAPNSFIKRQIDPNGISARTCFRVLHRYPTATFLEFILETGRTHQIRAHCEGFGHPLLGDDLYGGDTTFLTRHALHSSMYAFLHPATGLPIIIRAPFPKDLRDLLIHLKDFVTA